MFTIRMAAVSISALVLTGCAAASPPASPPLSSAASELPNEYLCDRMEIPREAEENRVPIAQISEALLTAEGLHIQPLDEPIDDGWYVGTATDDLIAVLRDVPESQLGDHRDKEVFSIIRTDGSENQKPGWHLGSHGTCALALDLGELTLPEVRLGQVDPNSLELPLLVTERSCNSGQDATGRIEIVSVTETDDRVSIVLGVRPRKSDQTCPGHPATPFTVTLLAPLGDREVVNGALANPRPIEPSARAATID